jgi:hypothetical protein
MVTRQQLEQRLAGLNEERRRLRALADLNGPLQREIEALRARIPTITDPVELQRAQARLAQAQNEIGQARERLFVIADEIQAVDNQIFELDRGVQETASRAQGPGTVSTGTTVSQGQQANAERADSQSPAPPAQTVTAAGAVTNTPASTNPSNAAASQTPVPTAPPAPNVLPSGQVGAAPDPAATVPVARGSQSPGAALQSGLVNLQSADIDNTLVSYVYRATQVTSSFRQGRFTQEIEGAQVFFQLPKKPQPPAPQTESVAVAPGRGATPAVPQGTVSQTASTPGTVNLGVNFAGSEFGAFFGTGETGQQSQLVDGALPGLVPGGLRPPGSPPAQRVLPGSTFEAEGFGDPTAVQGTAQAPLQSRSPTSGTTNIAPRSRGNRGNTSEPTKVAPQQGAREY